MWQGEFRKKNNQGKILRLMDLLGNAILPELYTYITMCFYVGNKIVNHSLRNVFTLLQHGLQDIYISSRRMFL